MADGVVAAVNALAVTFGKEDFTLPSVFGRFV